MEHLSFMVLRVVLYFPGCVILDYFDRGAADYVLLHLGSCLWNQNWFVNCVLQICNQHGFSSLIKTHMGV